MRFRYNIQKKTNIKTTIGFFVLLSLFFSVILTLSAEKQKQTTSSHAAGSSPCLFESTQPGDPSLNIAFCEPFDNPAGTGNRSGDLNGTIWGVSRTIGNVNFGGGQYNAAPATQLVDYLVKSE